MDNYENLCLSGGGAKVFSYLGALDYLSSINILNNFRRIIGSSGGALIGMFLMCSTDIEQIKIEVINFPTEKLKDDDIGIIRDAHRFLKCYGICKGDFMENSLGDILKKYHNKHDITFEELYTITNKEFIVTISNVTTGQAEYCNHINTPKMEVKHAVRISMSVPWLYQSVSINGSYYVDGGCFDNFPITYWDNQDVRNMNTLGLLVMTENELKGNARTNISTFIQYSRTLLQGAINMASYARYKDELNVPNNRIIKINVYDTDPFNFNIPDEMRNKLYESGYNSCVDFFNKGTKITNFDFTKYIVQKKENSACCIIQ